MRHLVGLPASHPCVGGAFAKENNILGKRFESVSLNFNNDATMRSKDTLRGLVMHHRARDPCAHKHVVD